MHHRVQGFYSITKRVQIHDHKQIHDRMLLQLQRAHLESIWFEGRSYFKFNCFEMPPNQIPVPL